jgi:hypothetical protein
MEHQTEIVEVYLNGAHIGTVNTQVDSNSDGAFAVIGGMWVPYRPKLTAGGATARANVGPWVAQCAGLA